MYKIVLVCEDLMVIPVVGLHCFVHSEKEKPEKKDAKAVEGNKKDRRKRGLFGVTVDECQVECEAEKCAAFVTMITNDNNINCEFYSDVTYLTDATKSTVYYYENQIGMSVYFSILSGNLLENKLKNIIQNFQ